MVYSKWLYQKKMPRSATSYFPLTQHFLIQNIFEYIYLILYSQMLRSKPSRRQGFFSTYVSSLLPHASYCGIFKVGVKPKVTRGNIIGLPKSWKSIISLERDNNKHLDMHTYITLRYITYRISAIEHLHYLYNHLRTWKK